MPKTKTQNAQSPNKKPPLTLKSSSSKKKSIKLYKSIQKLNSIKNSYQVSKVAKSNQICSKQQEFSPVKVKKYQNSDWDYKIKKSVSPNKAKKTNSDQQSTKANGLFESCQLYQTFMQKIAKQKQQDSKRESKTTSQNLEQSLKTRIEQFKKLQKQHDQEIVQLKNKLSAEQTRRLQKIQSIQKHKIHNQILSLQKKFKVKDQLKYSLQLSIHKK